MRIPELRRPQNPLLVLFLAGTLLIALIRVFAPGLLGAFIASFLAVSAVGALALLHWQKPERDLRVAGDEAYYLGLLFTLASLIIALLQLFVFRPEDAQLQSRTHELIGNFGVALVSTVAGILARVMLQSRSDGRKPPGGPAPGDDPSEPSADLLALRREIRQATDALSHFRRMTFRYAEDARVHTERLIREFNEQTALATRGELSATAESWRDLAKQIMRDHQQLVTRADLLVTDLGTQLHDAATSKLEEVANSWDSAGTKLSAQGEALALRLEASATAAAERAAAAWVPVIDTLQDAAAAARDRMTADVREMSATLSSLESARKGLEGLVTATSAAATRLESLATQVESASTRLDTRASEIVEAHRTLIEEMDELRNSVLTDLREKLDSSRRQLAEDGDRWHQTVQQLAVDGHDQIAAAQRVNEQLSDHADRWSEVADKTNRSLTAVVDELTDIARKG